MLGVECLPAWRWQTVRLGRGRPVLGLRGQRGRCCRSRSFGFRWGSGFMRKLGKSWLGRLEELGKGESFSHPQGVPSVIRVGLVKASLTPAGLVALRTGFLPAERDPDRVPAGRARPGASAFPCGRGRIVTKDLALRSRGARPGSAWIGSGAVPQMRPVCAQTWAQRLEDGALQGDSQRTEARE